MMSAGSGVRVTCEGTTTPTLSEKLMLVTGRTLVFLMTVAILVVCSFVTLTFAAALSFCWRLFCALSCCRFCWLFCALAGCWLSFFCAVDGSLELGSLACWLLAGALVSDAALLSAGLLVSDAALLVSDLLVSEADLLASLVLAPVVLLGELSLFCA